MPDNRYRFATFLRNFFSGEALEVRKLNHSALPRLQHRKYFLDQACCFLRRKLHEVPDPTKQLAWHQFIQIGGIIEPIRSKVLSPINATVVSELKQPRLETGSLGIELRDGPKHIEENLLNGLLGFAIISQDGTGDTEDQATMSFK
jgi:hypothetical protein